VTLPSSAYCCPETHEAQLDAVASTPVTIVKLVALAKCGSKYTSVSAGAVRLSNRFTSATSVSVP